MGRRCQFQRGQVWSLHLTSFITAHRFVATIHDALTNLRTQSSLRSPAPARSPDFSLQVKLLLMGFSLGCNLEGADVWRDARDSFYVDGCAQLRVSDVDDHGGWVGDGQVPVGM